MFSARRCLSTQPLRPVVSSAARPRLLRQYAQKRVPSERSSLLPQSSSLTDFRMRIMSAANLGSTNDCLQLAASMKQANLTPDASTYNAILSVLAKDRLHQFAWAVLEDMKKMGIRPDATAYSNFIQVGAITKLGELLLMSTRHTPTEAENRFVEHCPSSSPPECNRRLQCTPPLSTFFCP